MKKEIIKKNKNGGLSLRRNEVTGKGETSVFIQNHTDGFTLIEALVAVSILMIAIAGPMTLAQKSLMSANLAQDQMIAGSLAQDAIESVRNIRDQMARNQSLGADWLTGINNNGLLYPCVCNLDGDRCNFDLPNLKYCTFDSTSRPWAVSTFFDSPQSIDPGGDPVPILTKTYNINISTGATTFLKYGYATVNGTSVIPSKFTRYINIKEDPSETNKNEALISVRVSWNTPSGIQNYPLQVWIYNYSGNQ